MPSPTPTPAGSPRPGPSDPSSSSGTSPAPASATARRALLFAVWAFVVAAFAVVVGVVALAGGAGGTPGAESCRQVAWNADVVAADLPAGWTVGASQVAVDGLATSVVGPAPTDATSGQSTVYVMVSCYGADATAGLDRSRSAAEAAGELTVDRPDLGEAGFAIVDTSSATTAVYFRQGGLVAYAAPSGTVDPADLDAIAAAVALAVDRALAGGTPPPAPTDVPGAPTDFPGASPAASVDEVVPEPSQAAPDLLAMLPSEVAGTALARDSATGADILGTDAASRALVASLTSLGATPEQLLVAQAYDETETIDLYLLAFQLPGTPATKLAPAIIDTWLLGDAAGVDRSPVTLGGHEVTKVSYGDGGASSYVVESGEAVIVVETTDQAVATEALAALP